MVFENVQTLHSDCDSNAPLASISLVGVDLKFLHSTGSIFVGTGRTVRVGNIITYSTSATYWYPIADKYIQAALLKYKYRVVSQRHSVRPTKTIKSPPKFSF